MNSNHCPKCKSNHVRLAVEGKPDHLWVNVTKEDEYGIHATQEKIEFLHTCIRIQCQECQAKVECDIQYGVEYLKEVWEKPEAYQYDFNVRFYGILFENESDIERATREIEYGLGFPETRTNII